MKRTEDLGLGSAVASQKGSRIVNRDGSFAIARVGLGLRGVLSAYHSLLTMSWPAFLVLCAAIYLLLNVVFTLGYLALDTELTSFRRAFFLSVQTSSTVGYGGLVPSGLGANLLMTVHSFVSLISIALMTGLVFARFSRPRAYLLFSDTAVVAPYHGRTGLMFRIANKRRSQIVDLRAKLILSILTGGQRQFHELPLEREHVSFLPLTWTIVHPIDENSPLFGVTEEQYRERQTEVIVLLTGIDDTVSQTVHKRCSYVADEVAFARRFVRIYSNEPGPIRMDLNRIHDTEGAV